MDRDFKQYHRGEIYFANLNPAYGCEHGGIRPVLILQNDVGNFYSPTLIVTPATKQARQKAISADTRCSEQDPRNEV